ncbi:MAG: sodium-translocating pyrophosphatase [Firmicutes bacterium]|nr:sodium-translocating pyrophosphatase [Bacillota bacterium]
MDLDLFFLLGYVGVVAGLGFAFYQVLKLRKFSEGTPKMVDIAKSIRTGANAYMKRQYKVIAIFFGALFVIMFILSTPLFGIRLLNAYTPFAFISGGLFTGLAGFIGMKVATYSNARTAHAAEGGLNKALRVAFSSGTVMGFVVNGLGLLDITTWFLVLNFGFKESADVIAEAMITFGMGLAVMAMFARVGGGIFTKAADVGADLVGKVEKNIPEDDPRNPAVIADNVGDNVGDVAGMGADLYQSNSSALVATIAIGIAAKYDFAGLLLPILISVVGVLASLIGTFFVRTKEKVSQKSLLRSLRMGVYIAGAIAAIATLPVILGVAFNAPPFESLVPVMENGVAKLDAEGNAIMETVTTHPMWENAGGIFASVVFGIVAGFAVSFFTEHYTSDASKPTRELAESSQSGTGPLIIGGMSLGMLSSAGPILAVGAATIASFIASGGHGFFANGSELAFSQGLYGIGLSAVAMLATNAIILATDAFGPVADNAGGIAEMAGLPHEVRERTDALDSLGNTTAATGKGFAIAAAAFTALALLVSYVQTVGKKVVLDLSLVNPPVLVGLFLGAMLVFVFGAMLMSGVRKAAQSIVTEVRRQFREIPGLMEGTGKADYAQCVSICTKAAQKEMIIPCILAIVSPIAVGLVLGPAGVVGMLAGVLATGFVTAIYMLNAGGAWDNAKKYIEAGRLAGKGKGSEEHKSAVVGDTVGDPMKDTAGPSFNILIVLTVTVAIVFAGVTASFNLASLF